MAEGNDQSRIRELEAENAQLRQELAEARAEIAQLREKLEEVLHELARAKKDSTTSSKPPSSDIVKKKKSKKGRRKGNRGGQPGHKRHEREPFSEDEIDEVVDYTLSDCPGCGGALEKSDEPPRTQQQVELVENPVHITEHRAHVYWCGGCQKIIVPIFPTR